MKKIEHTTLMKIQKGFVNAIVLIIVLVSAALVALFVLPKSTTAPIHPTLNPSGDSVPTPRGGEKLYSGVYFSFNYPENILVYPKNPPASESIYFTNKENVDSPRGLPKDGIWVEAARYPASAKDNLIADIKSLFAASVGAKVTHPITPYSEKFTKIKNIGGNGLLIRSTDEKDINDSREIESAFWLVDDSVYQLRIVVVTQKAFDSFEETFNQIISSFTVHAATTSSCSIDADCGEGVCNQAYPSTCYTHKCINNECVTRSNVYGTMVPQEVHPY